MNSSFQIRKLPASVIKELEHTLEYCDNWKKLMSIIPKVLEKDDYQRCVALPFEPKYKSEHIR